MGHMFERYCKDYENIENYEKAKKEYFVGWDCHHRNGELIPTEELKSLGLYYNRPAEELIFLTESEHHSLHNTGNQHFKGKKHSEEAKKKQSEAKKGNQNAKGHSVTEEHKKKISEARRGRHWYNNGKENKLCYECPEGYKPGRLLIK